MPSPISTEGHADPHADLMTWLGNYRTDTPGVRHSDNPTVRLGPASMPQPDGSLRVVAGGQATTVGGYMTGGPELAAEVAASSVGIDRGAKLRTYQAARIQEYILWRTEDREIDWFVLEGGVYVPLPPGPDGILRSRVFPGLWLDPAALIAGDMRRVRQVLDQGIASPEHAAFVAGLQAAVQQAGP
jgi:Uma2 family endonuclease